MKGFYIQITNNLLDPKHVKKMGSAVWEYMWCLDKMTSVNEAGIGKVLGGKPIKLDELGKDLGHTHETISRNLIRLEAEGYIEKRRTPYGLVIMVLKAKKRFGKNVESRTKNVESRTKNVESNIRQYQYDMSVDIARPASKEALGRGKRNGKMTSLAELLPNLSPEPLLDIANGIA